MSSELEFSENSQNNAIIQVFYPTCSAISTNYNGLEIRPKDTKKFLKKVMTLLYIQLSITILLSAIILSVKDIQKWIQSNNSFQLVSLGLSIISIAALRYRKTFAKKVPINYTLCAIFNIGVSVIIGNFVGIHFKNLIIFLAVSAFTIAIQWNLAMVALFIQKDLTKWYGAIFEFLIAGILAGIFLLPYLTNFVKIGFCVLFFSIYVIAIIIDFQAINGNGVFELTNDDYITGAIFLFVEVVGFLVYVIIVIFIF
ncbi:unnamed protein product [Blepharisma stoltei]|uniref:Uncharacterized protein n=1 Tax=Blepharisma stoltei TaxID=1481888 RepID=A0AAU9IFM9_9CILI|nr:unnamed protein product [Blepharisma stoltei]